MPALLRAALAAIAVVGVTASPFLLILSGPTAIHAPTIVIQTIAVCALWSAPTAAGSIVSAWSASDADAARRLRRAVLVCAAIAVLGAVALVATGGPLIPMLGIAVVALAAFPLCLAIGRAARRAEVRSGFPGSAADGVLADVDADLRTGRRRGLVGGAIGLAAAIAIGLPIGLLPGSSERLPLEIAGFAVAFTILGVSIGRMTVSLRLARRAREVLGTDYGAARRTGRIIRGRAEPATPEEAATAARYARVAMRTVPFQSWSSLSTMIAVVAMQVPTAIDEGLDPIRVFIFGLFTATVVAVLPLQVVQARRIRRYAAAHPLPA